MGKDLLEIGLICMVCVAFTSLIASTITLTLIRMLRKWNGYLQLVTSLTVCQAIYDFAFLLLIWYNYYPGRLVYEILHTFGGLSSTFWSNIILLITYRIAKHLRSVKIEQEYRLYFYSVTIFSAVFATVNGFFMRNNAVNFIYLSLKTLSVLLNIVLLALILHKVYHIMKISSGTNLRHRSVPGEAPPRSNPVYVLVTRLQYYCVVQTFTRIGASWYQIQYGFDSDSYDKNDASVMQNVAMFAQFILTPAAGTGYLLVFLTIQPDAYKLFRSLIKKIFCCCLGSSQSEQERPSGGKAYRTEFSQCQNDKLLTQHGHRMSSFEVESQRASSEVVFTWTAMDEDDIAREIDRIYTNGNLHGRSICVSEDTAGTNTCPEI